jgi:hypothetical protein
MSTKAQRPSSYRRTWRGAIDYAVRTHTTWLDRCWEATSRYHRNKQDSCEGCGGDPELLHHVVPLMAGGTSDSDLMMVLCHDCHGGAHRLLAGTAFDRDVLLEAAR